MPKKLAHYPRYMPLKPYPKSLDLSVPHPRHLAAAVGGGGRRTLARG
jgi:hypothetical protein